MPDAHRYKVVTNTGIIHPTVLLDGQVRAKWKVVKETLVVTPFERISIKRQKAVKRAAKRVFGKEVAEVAFAEWKKDQP